MAASQTSSETSGGTEAEITSRPLGFVDLRPYWRTPLVDGIDDEVADAARAPEALGAFAPDAAAVAPVGRGYTQRVELGCDAHAAPAVYGEMVIDAPDNVGGGEVAHMGESSGTRRRKPRSPETE